MYNACIDVNLYTMLVLVWVYVQSLYWCEFMYNVCIGVNVCTMIVLEWDYVQWLY